MNDKVSLPHDEAQPMSLRERKKRLAQATIEETALRLFQQQGYEQTSIQDIADAVMMSPRTFFRYCLQRGSALWTHARGPERWSPLSAARGANGVTARSTQSDLCLPGQPVSAAAGQFSDPLSGRDADPIDRFHLSLCADGNGASHL